MKIKGNVGIGPTSPNYKLEVAGTAAAQSWQTTSDSRFKKDIVTIDGALDKVSTLRGVSFEWRWEDYPDKNLAEGRKIGLIAQEVEKVLPEAVSTDDNGYKSVEYGNMVGVLVEAIKELNAKHEEAINALKAENEALKARISALETSK